MTDKLQPNIDIICRTNSSVPVNCEVVLCKRRLELCFLYDIELQKNFRISITMNMYKYFELTYELLGFINTAKFVRRDDLQTTDCFVLLINIMPSELQPRNSELDFSDTF